MTASRIHGERRKSGKGDGAGHPAGRPGANRRRTAARDPRIDLRSLAAVERALVACELCPRLRAHCLAIARAGKRAFRGQTYWGKPVPSFGDPRARLLVIGLAPAAHGGNRTGRIFTGDSSGSWLYEALHRYGFANQPDSTGRGDGLRLDDCYVTAAAHCAPPANKPTREELDRCRPYLEAELRLLTEVRVVLALGRIGWESWMKVSRLTAILSPGERPVFGHGAEFLLPDGRTLLSSYHPSRQNTNTGKLTRPMWHRIFARARELVDGNDRRRPAIPLSPVASISPCPDASISPRPSNRPGRKSALEREARR